MKHAEVHNVRETKVVMRGKNDKVLRCEPLNLPLGHWREGRSNRRSEVRRKNKV